MSQAGVISIASGGGATSFVEDVGAAAPVAGVLNILGGTGITTTGAGNTVTIDAVGGGFTWNVVSSNQVGANDNAYDFVAPGGALTISLPAASSVGDEIVVTLDGATSWQITQGAGQQIRISNSQTTLGVGGSLTSTAQGDTAQLVCTVANTKWNVISVIGNITVV